MTHKKCPHLLDDLSDYLDGETSEKVCAEIERRLADCENCQAVVDTLRKTVFLYRDMPQPTMPNDTRKRLYHALDLDTFLPSD
ncbi:MAG: hypothetical protein GY803_26620 [Chloroflexi bacterium]|nr:hypothetical protein [Chloroflexota bacterium]